MRFTSILALVIQAQKIKFRDIQALTFRKDEQTKFKRSYAVPQLVCVGNLCPSKHLPEIVQCQNVGFDGSQVQWKCTAELDNSIILKETTVICEGYSHKDDEYVLVGSCGLEYSLSKRNNHESNHETKLSSNQDELFSQKFVLILIVLFVMYWIYSCMQPPRHAYAAPSNSANDGGDSNTRMPGGFKSTEETNQNSQYQPGFFSGLGLGGLLGHLLTRNRSNRASNTRVYNADQSQQSSSNSRVYNQENYGPSTSSYFGESSTGGTRRREERNADANKSTSTGYGGSRSR